MFDTEKFIAVIERYPPLYDQHCSKHNTKSIRAYYWARVGEILYHDWHSLDPKEQGEKVQLLTKKWKSLRDSFVKEYKEMKKIEIEGTKRRKRKYLHFDSLRFLLPYYLSGNENSTNAEDTAEQEDEEEQDVKPFCHLEFFEEESSQEMFKKRQKSNNSATSSNDTLHSVASSNDAFTSQNDRMFFRNVETTFENQDIIIPDIVPFRKDRNQDNQKLSNNDGTNSRDGVTSNEGTFANAHSELATSFVNQDTIEPSTVSLQKDERKQNRLDSNSKPFKNTDTPYNVVTTSSETMAFSNNTSSSGNHDITVPHTMLEKRNQNRVGNKIPSKNFTSTIDEHSISSNNSTAFGNQSMAIVPSSAKLKGEDKDQDKFGNRAFLLSFAPIMDHMPQNLFIQARLKIAQVFSELVSNTSPDMGAAT